MKKFILITLSVLFSLNLAQAAERDYVKGDGDMDFTCFEADNNARPHHTFEFVMYYDKNESSENVLKAIFDKNTINRGEAIYKVTAMQMPFFGAEIVANPQPLRGCQAAPITVTADGENQFEVYFECNADGDAGYGLIKANVGGINAEINFPEGNNQFRDPIVEDTSINLVCRF